MTVDSMRDGLPDGRGAGRAGFARPASTALVAALAGLVLLAAFAVLLAAPGRGLPDPAGLAALVSGEDGLARAIVLHLRLPRVAAGALAGGAFALSGVLFQAVTRNPLASPGILGVTAGAWLAMVVQLVLLPAGAGPPPLLVAFMGGAGAALLTYAMAGGVRATPVGLALAGVAVSLALGAAAGAITLLHENAAAGLFLWGAGTLAQPDWSGPLEALPRVALCAGLALLLVRAFDVLALGEDAARGLGQNVQGLRAGAAALATLLAASAVVLVGPIGFVGLVVPNALRLAGVRRHAVLVPLSALWGAVLLLGADLLARMLGGDDLPTGIAAAAVGAPLLVLLLRRAVGRRPVPRSGGHAVSPAGLPPGRVLAVAGAGLGVVAVLGLSAGASGLSLGWLTGGAAGPVPLLDLRLPRMLVAMLVGAMLAASGTLLQGVTRNPLASPDLMGVSQGAGLAALTALLLVPGLPLAGLQAAALAGGAGVLALVLLLAGRRAGSPEAVALTGIAIGAFCAAASSFAVARADLQVAQALVWLSGSTYGRGWDALAFLLPWAAVLLPASLLLARWLDLLGLGDDAARSLGLPAGPVRILLLGVATALAGAAVAVAGAVAFVGLVAPHAAGLLCGGGHRRRLLVAVLLGALLLGCADLLGRVVLSPREMPVGLVTALLGAPYFLFMLRRLHRSGIGALR